MASKENPVFDWHSLPENYPARYERLNRNYAHIYERAASRLVALASIEPGDVVIDLGAGTGVSTEVIASAVGENGRVLAVDPSQPMLELAAKKTGLPNVTWRQGGAEQIESLAANAGLTNHVDGVLSNFTYYYTYMSRSELHESAYRVLRPGGWWTFNLTKYLGELVINGTTYNEFGRIYVDQLREVLQSHGIESTTDDEDATAQFADASWELDQLRSAGFGNTRVEAWPLPLSPSEAFQFTIDGFYQFGSRVTFLPGLMDIPLEKRVQLLREALDACAEELDAYESPHVANFVSEKPR